MVLRISDTIELELQIQVSKVVIYSLFCVVFYTSFHIIKLILQCPSGSDGIKEMILKLENPEETEVYRASIEVNKCTDSYTTHVIRIRNEGYYNLTLSAITYKGTVFQANSQQLSECISL